MRLWSMYLNVDSVDNYRLLNGFDGAVLNDLINKNECDNLFDSYPTDELHPYTTGQKQYDGHAILSSCSFNITTIFVSDLRSSSINLSNSWKQFLTELLDKEYINKITKISGIDLSEKEVCFEFLEYGQHDGFHRHYDHQPGKLVNQLFYLNPFWDRSWGGLLKVTSPDGDLLSTIEPRSGNSVIINCNENAWHEVTPVSVKAKVSRKVLQMQWFERGKMINDE